MIKTRNRYELELMRKSGQITARALKKVIETVQPGVSLLDLERVAQKEIAAGGGKPSFPTVGNYQWATCLTVNHELVHGTPREIPLKEGDVLGIDIGAVYKGWHTDAAWSVIVGETSNGEKRRFLAVGEEALWKAIRQAVAGNRLGAISNAIQTTVEGAGYSVSDTLVGHGVGRSLHESPNVPGLGSKNSGPELLENQTLAIEVIYAQQDARVVLEEDGWTYSTRDKSLGGLFEMSVVVKDRQAEVLTDWRKA